MTLSLFLPLCVSELRGLQGQQSARSCHDLCQAPSFTVCLYFMSAALMFQKGPACLISGAAFSHLLSLKSHFL